MRQDIQKIYDHVLDVGPVIPEGFPRHRHRWRDFEGVGAEMERVLHAVQRNLVRLTRQVPMIMIEDLPKEMQRRMVGVPWDWVQLFRCVANVIVYFLASCSSWASETDDQIFLWLDMMMGISPNFVGNFIPIFVYYFGHKHSIYIQVILWWSYIQMILRLFLIF